MKKALLVVWLTMLFTGIACTFWYCDWVYLQPTPMPVGYKSVPAGTVMSLPATIPVIGHKPVFFHFFNPDCPCSRFNMEHFRSLFKRYHEDVDFIVVVVSKKHYRAEQIRKGWGLDLQISFDTSLAGRFGVYSTPQAVVLDSRLQLFYRGNYNRSRYCTDKKTNYAQAALEKLVKHERPASFDRNALIAYGCQLPHCAR